MATLLSPLDTKAEGRAVKVLLAAKDLTQQDLAEMVGTDTGTLSRLLSGQRYSPELWKRIWLALTNGGNGHA